MKKKLLLVGVLAACMLGTVGFAACDTSETEHVHNWGEWVTVTAPTCETAGEKKRTCLDDPSHTETDPIEKLGHNWGDWTLKTAGDCQTAGVEERVCKNDANHKETRDAALGAHDLQPHEAVVPANCTKTGNTAYWECTICGKFFDSAEATHEIDENSWIYTGAHVWQGHVEKAATCTAEGNDEYWECTACGKYFTDNTAKEELEEGDWIRPMTDHVLTEHPAVPKTCDTAGSIRYWQCSKCNKYFDDDEADPELSKSHEIGQDTLAVPASHELQKQEAKDAACGVDGNVLNWECTVCHKHFKDANAEEEFTGNSWLREALEHQPTKHDAKDVTCTEDGNLQYYQCDLCHKYFKDFDCTEEYEGNSWFIQSEGHRFIEHPAKQPSCTEAGNEAYWECTKCKKYFKSAEATEEFTKDEWALEMIPHQYGPDGHCKTCGAEKKISFTTTEADGKLTITGLAPESTDTEIVIPSTIDGKPVVAIAANAFKSNTMIQSVIIPESVLTIGNYAFQECAALVSVEITGTGGESGTVVNTSVFQNCALLKSVTIHGDFKSIGSSMFKDCKVLSEVSLGDSLTSIGLSMFNGCAALENIVLPATMKTIGSTSFSTSGIKEIDIPASVEKIDGNTFLNCKSLTRVGLVSGLKQIGNAAFSGCEQLSDITLPDTLTALTNGVFTGTAIASMTIPASVTADGIGGQNGLSNLFKDCKQLQSVTILAEVQSLGLSFFSGCTSLREVNLPTTLTWIGSDSFANCNALKHLDIRNVAKCAGTPFKNVTGLEWVISNFLNENYYNTAFKTTSIPKIYINNTTSPFGAKSFSGWTKVPTVYLLSEADPAGQEGNFWHDVNGQPVEWGAPAAALEQPVAILNDSKHGF